MKVEKSPEDKKKIMVIGALGLLLVGIGAFQFMPGAPEPAPAAKAKPKVDAAKDLALDAPKNPEVANSLPSRDPFEGPEPPDNGKKSAAAPPKADSNVPYKMSGALPPGKDSQLPGAGAGAEIRAVEAPPFAYAVAGTVVGEHSVVVFRDSQGRQRLVREGDSLDGDTQVISIQKSQVTVVYRGKTLHLKTGGNAVAK